MRGRRARLVALVVPALFVLGAACNSNDNGGVIQTPPATSTTSPAPTAPGNGP
jgi:hypothetical protein